MRTYFLYFCFITGIVLSAQNNTPRIFKLQERAVTKKIQKYLHHDTIIETQQAFIHINYSNDPKKPYLLLLHGMGVDAKTNWFKQVAYLSRYYNLLMPDLVYFGKSRAKETNYSVEFQVEQIHEAIRKIISKEKISVMGFSYGGLTTAMYNEIYPGEVNKLVIIDGPVKFFSIEMADSLAKIAGVESMTSIIVPQTLSDFSAMQKAVLSKKYPATRKLKRKLIAHYFSPTLKSRQLQLSYLSSHQSAYQNYNYNLDKTPTLLIWGKKDGVVPVYVGEKLHASYPGTTRLIIYKKAKHDTHFRCAKKLNKAVISFLKN
ncbi:hypothetical protein CNR22_20720 [Sphingobacteriaceae bacterium]|nr:hypothetical protein CNR22_20720 [Sphingobacteriaceae bacterium]